MGSFGGYIRDHYNGARELWSRKGGKICCRRGSTRAEDMGDTP